MAAKKITKKKKNVYIIRKSVKADSMAEALKKERRAPVLDIILCSPDGTQLQPMIGFQAAQNYEENEEEE